MGRNFGSADRAAMKVLEVGCGPGANLWYLHREGYRIAGIDGSPAAIEAAGARIPSENLGFNDSLPDLKVGDFSVLPWADATFDVAVDIYAVYANTLPVIRSALAEVHRVLKPGGRFYAKLWGRRTTGYGLGKAIEPGTYDAIPDGPFRNMGVTHFFAEDEIREEYARFRIERIDISTRTDHQKGHFIEEFLCQFAKPG
jgi:SAM-dependent methyltransferase